MSVCKDNDSFKEAFKKAVEYTEEKADKPLAMTRIVSTLIYIILIVWAVILAMKVPEDRRLLHLVLGLVFSPLYIIAHYLNMSRK
jgi:ABC-type Na+ efflux pump permease subunit